MTPIEQAQASFKEICDIWVEVEASIERMTKELKKWPKMTPPPK